MANVAHSTLTGSDLHEVKGASTATAGKVPIADGAGGAPFGLLTHTSLQTTGNPFGAQLFHAIDYQSGGTAGQTLLSAAWRTVRLSTAQTNEITSASLASNQITLPAGTYFAEADIPIYAAGATQCMGRIYNTTTAARLLISQSAPTNGGYVHTLSIRGRFTLAGSSVLELQVISNAGVLVGLSFGAYTGEYEKYADVAFWKVA